MNYKCIDVSFLLFIYCCKQFSFGIIKFNIIFIQNRLDSASASILTLESKVRDLSTADTTAAEMLKQVRDTAEAELKKFQIESEEQYSRNVCISFFLFMNQKEFQIIIVNLLLKNLVQQCLQIIIKSFCFQCKIENTICSQTIPSLPHTQGKKKVLKSDDL